jgi:tungstate transport system ATP-binding protein
MLSGGEQQKLALIGALAARPDILFLDEPTAHLDFAATKFVETMVRNAHEDGMTIVITSHNRTQAERLGEDVILLDSGRIVETAPASQFFTTPSHPLAKQYLAHL